MAETQDQHVLAQPGESGAKVADVVVIGDGTAALAATLSLARMNLHVVVIGAGNRRNDAAEHIHGYLGHDGESPANFYASALEQVSRYPTVTVKSAEIIGIEGARDDFVAWSRSARFTARRLLFATGTEDVLPTIDGLADLWGRGAHACVYCHGWELRGRSVAVLASEGQLPVGTAMRLAWLGCTVTLFTDSDEPVAAHTSKALRALGIETRSSRIVSVGTERGEQVVRTADGDHLVSGVFVRTFPKPRSGLAASLGCGVTDSSHLRVDGGWQTTVAGVYAAGDVARSGNNPALGSNVVSASASGYHAGISVFDDIWNADTQQKINASG